MTNINIQDYYSSAKSILPKSLWDFMEGGASDELTISMNKNDFNKIQIIPRRMVNIKQRDTSTSVLGQKIQFPVILAPIGGQRHFHEDGVLGSTIATESLGTINIIATNSGYSLEKVCEKSKKPHWFQIYHYNKNITRDLISRAENSGYSAICLTVDGVISDRRERDIRNNLILEESKWNANLINYPKLLKNLSFEVITYKTIEWVREITNLPLVIKGIISPEDAKILEKIGVNGIVVSNHGGRTTDSVQSSISALPNIKML